MTFIDGGGNNFYFVEVKCLSSSILKIQQWTERWKIYRYYIARSADVFLIKSFIRCSKLKNQIVKEICSIYPLNRTLFCFVLFCLVLFCFVLFCFVLFYFVLFCFVLFCFVLFCFVLFCFVLS